MGRILGIDYGKKRTGLAASDPLRIIVSALETVPTPQLFDHLRSYFEFEPVDQVVVGAPMGLDGQATDATPLVKTFIKQFKKQFPDIPITTYDERYSSKRAFDILLKSGIKQKKRRDKSLIDKVSAAVILQDYMEAEGLFSNQ
ncbi:MAG: Holliday junction resolvase RuvX [Bacteroidota bacterium]